MTSIKPLTKVLLGIGSIFLAISMLGTLGTAELPTFTMYNAAIFYGLGNYFTFKWLMERTT